MRTQKYTLYIAYIAVAVIGFLLGLILGMIFPRRYRENFSDQNLLKEIHNKLVFRHGSLEDEYPEQLLSVKYIKPTDKVLEIGGNVGRNSCVIASLLSDTRNLVVIESNPVDAQKLKDNRDANNMHFHIEDTAISNVELYQQNWITKPVNEIDEDGDWKKIKTIPWKEMKTKYNIRFNTLVVDCEGALFYILVENPNFLETFDKVIIENDFSDINHKQYVDDQFRKFKLRRIYHQAGGWGVCQEFFYAVWAK